MITLHIQLLSKVEMPFEEAKGFIACDFPKAASTLTTGNREQGIVQVILDQDTLTNEQRDWLHLSTFAAIYINGYTVEKEPRFQHYRTWLPLTLIFDQNDVDSQEEADRYIVSLSFEIAGVLHREFDSKGLREVRISNVEN